MIEELSRKRDKVQRKINWKLIVVFAYVLASVFVSTIFGIYGLPYLLNLVGAAVVIYVWSRKDFKELQSVLKEIQACAPKDASDLQSVNRETTQGG